MSDDLITWLRAQLDEDERVAREATPGPWRWVDPGGKVKQALVSGGYPWRLPGSMVLPSASGDVFPQVGDAAHIVRHDPARVLAEVEAKRRILDLHEPAHDPCDAHDAALHTITCDTVRLLAVPFADRPGYREEEWRP